MPDLPLSCRSLAQPPSHWTLVFDCRCLQTVLSAALDPLAASNLRLVKALEADGVAVTSLHVPCVPHGFLSFPSFGADARRCRQALEGLEVAIRASLEK